MANVLWYIAAALAWWVVGGVVATRGAYRHYDIYWLFGDFSFAVGLLAFFGVVLWFPFISWIALGEYFLFSRYPYNPWIFLAFLCLSLTIYSAIIWALPTISHLRVVLIWPAVAAAFVYCLRRSARPFPIRERRTP